MKNLISVFLVFLVPTLTGCGTEFTEENTQYYQMPLSSQEFWIKAKWYSSNKMNCLGVVTRCNDDGFLKVGDTVGVTFLIYRSILPIRPNYILDGRFKDNDGNYIHRMKRGYRSVHFIARDNSMIYRDKCNWLVDIFYEQFKLKSL